jgi:MFS family permease
MADTLSRPESGDRARLPGPEPGPAAGRFGMLGNRDLRRFLTGYAASMLGTAMTPVALTFAVLDRGGDAGDVGLVLTAESVPLVLLLLAGGVVSDRLPRRWVMVVADVVRACTQAVLALLLITGNPPLAVLMVAAAVLGAGQAFEGPALTPLLSEIVPADELHQTNALRSVAHSLGEGLGPAVGGVIVAAAGAGWAVAVDAGTYAFSAWCLSGLAIASPVRAAGGGSFLHDLRDGWQAFRSRTWLWVVVAQWSLLCLLVLPAYLVLGAVIADRDLGGARAWGLILAGEGLGAVAGGLAMLRLRFERALVPGIVGAGAFVLPLIGLAVGAPVVAVAAGSVLAGVGFSVFATTWETALQRHVEPEALARVKSYDWFGTVATLPIGYALVGPASGLLGIDGVLWLAVGVWSVSTAVVLTVPSVRRLGYGS